MPIASPSCRNTNVVRTAPTTPCAGLGNIRVWREIDQASQRLIAFHLHFLAWDSERTIWMDGRPHPGELAPHTWQGFSTGEWEGNMLTITTTHLKENYIRRNGVPPQRQCHIHRALDAARRLAHGNDGNRRSCLPYRTARSQR